MPILGAIVVACGGVLKVTGMIVCAVNPPIGIGLIAAGGATMAVGAGLVVVTP